MQRHIEIAPTEPRCRPFSRECAQLATCARNLAAPLAGKRPDDFSVTGRIYWPINGCSQFLSLEQAKQKAHAKPVKPWPKVQP